MVTVGNCHQICSNFVNESIIRPLDLFQLWCLGSSRKIAVAANRRSVDDHIVIIGWSSEGAQLEAYNIELSNDAWIPRIELQGYHLLHYLLLGLDGV
jgi:hypothetical protein